MVLGEYGLQSLKPRAQHISWVNAIISLIAIVFGIVGCVNYDNSFDNLTAAPWTWSRTDYTAVLGKQIYSAGGIQATAVYYYDDDTKEPFSSAQGYTDGVMIYSDCVNDLKDSDAATKTAQGYDRCVACSDASGSVIAMLSLAICCAGIACLMFVWRSWWDNFFAKDLSILASGFTWIFGLAAFCAFTSCSTATSDFASESSYPPDIKGFAAGAYLVLVSFIIAFFVFVLNVLTPVQGDVEPDAKAVPTNEMVEKDTSKA